MVTDPAAFKSLRNKYIESAPVVNKMLFELYVSGLSMSIPTMLLINHVACVTVAVLFSPVSWVPKFGNLEGEGEGHAGLLVLQEGRRSYLYGDG